MHERSAPHTASDPLDELATQLLDCGGVLSQIIASMVDFDARGHSSPDTVPIPEMAHGLIRSVIGDVRRHHSTHDVQVAAKIVREATYAISNDIFAVEPTVFDE